MLISRAHLASICALGSRHWHLHSTARPVAAFGQACSPAYKLSGAALTGASHRDMVMTRSLAGASSGSDASNATGAHRSSSASASHEGEVQVSHKPSVTEESLQKIHNFRDLSEECSNIHPGHLYRSSAPNKATQQDVDLLFTSLCIKEMIDLRSTEEIVTEDKHNPLIFRDASFCKYRLDSGTKMVLPDPNHTIVKDSGIMRSQISLLERSSYYKAILGRLTFKEALWLIGMGIYDSKRSKTFAIGKVNEGGLDWLYEIILDTSARQIGAVMRIILNAAEKGRPVMFFCKAGKDRTGMVAAMVLHVMGATDEQILKDYERSDKYHMVALAGIDKQEELQALDKSRFERAPRECMQHALAHIRRKAGDIPTYLERFCGFSLQEQERLRQALSQPPLRNKL